MYEYKILEVVKIYDGDTITVILDLGFGISKKEVIRLYGIDTPELRGEQRPEGLVSRARLVELIKDAEGLTIKTYKDKKGKYGRMLGNIMATNYEESLNQILVNEGLATDYFGGKK
jgi:micrococcal nuclease